METSQMDKTVITYTHHGKVVAVYYLQKGQHKEYCLCYACSKFSYNKEKNCPIAQKVFSLCVEENLVLPVWECPSFEHKDSS
jgi:hypothetical protein